MRKDKVGNQSVLPIDKKDIDSAYNNNASILKSNAYNQ